MPYYFTNRTYNKIPVGIEIRRDIGEITIFRIRRGNGYYGSRLGEKYQDKYDYFVPDSITNIEGQPARDALTQAVYNWKHILTEEEKAEYNRRAGILSTLSGYNLYVGEYVEENA